MLIIYHQNSRPFVGHISFSTHSFFLALFRWWFGAKNFACKIPSGTIKTGTKSTNSRRCWKKILALKFLLVMKILTKHCWESFSGHPVLRYGNDEQWQTITPHIAIMMRRKFTLSLSKKRQDLRSLWAKSDEGTGRPKTGYRMSEIRPTWGYV